MYEDKDIHYYRIPQKTRVRHRYSKLTQLAEQGSQNGIGKQEPLRIG